MKKWLSLAVVVWSLGRILLAYTVVVDGSVWTCEVQVHDGENDEETWEGCKIRGVLPKPTGTLTIPSQLDGCKVTAIGEEAFKGCMGLENVVIPDGVEEIGEGAFAGCTNLASVAIPASVTSIFCGDGDYGCSGTFDGCGGLTNIMVDAANEHYSSQGGLLLTKDGTVLVRGINGDVVIPSTVTRICCRAFSGCAGLTSVAIPSGVSNFTCYDHDWWDWWNGGSTFDGCSSLTNIMVDVANERYSSQDGLLLTKDGTVLVRGINGDVVIPSTVTRICRGAFRGASGLKRVTIPSSVEEIGEGAFSGCSSLDGIAVDPENVFYFSWKGMLIEDYDDEYDDEFEDYYGYGRCYDTTLVRGINGVVEIPFGVTKIGKGAFEGCTGLTDVTLPSSVECIGEQAFSGCTGLTDVALPSSVECIGERAFEGCTGLTDVAFPSNVECIGEWAFSGCTGLTDVALPSSVGYIGEGAFKGCVGLTSVTLPACVMNADGGEGGSPRDLERIFDLSCVTNVVVLDGVNYIGYSTFSRCVGLTSVTLPDGVREICGDDEGAFSGCTGLTSITIPGSVRRICASAFSRCSGLTSVTIPGSVRCIGEDAFSGCVGLANVTISDGVRTIGEGAFSGCTGLTSVTIPGSVMSVNFDDEVGEDEDGRRTFEGCSSLMYIAVDPANKFYSSRNGLLLTKDGTTLVQGVNGDVVIPSGVTRIAGHAFSGFSGLTSVSIPPSVKEIGDKAFRGCTGLASVTIPANVTEIGYRAFLGCSGLTNFTVDAANESYVSANGLLLTRDGSVLIRGVNGDVVIPDGVTRKFVI